MREFSIRKLAIKLVTVSVYAHKVITPGPYMSILPRLSLFLCRFRNLRLRGVFSGVKTRKEFEILPLHPIGKLRRPLQFLQVIGAV